MEKLCSGGLASSMKDVGKTVKSFPTKHVFTTLLLMLLCMLMPQKGWATPYTYDFSGLTDQNLSSSSTTDDGLAVLEQYPNLAVSSVIQPESGQNHWYIHNGALYLAAGGNRNMAILNLRNGDKLKITFVKNSDNGKVGEVEIGTNYDAGTFVSTNAWYYDESNNNKKTAVTTSTIIESGKEYYISQDGNLKINFHRYIGIKTVTVERVDNPSISFEKFSDSSKYIGELINLAYDEPNLTYSPSTATVTFTSSNEKVAKTTGESHEGDLMFINTGVTTITASMTVGGVTYSDSYTVTVSADDATWEVDGTTYKVTGTGKLQDRVVTQVPYITMEFGSTSVVNTTIVRDETSDASGLVATTIDQNGWRQIWPETANSNPIVPYQGSFYTFKPAVGGTLTYKGYSSRNNTTVLVDATANYTVLKTYAFSSSTTAVEETGVALTAGHTYYLYGNTPNTNGSGGWNTFQLYSFGFVPNFHFSSKAVRVSAGTKTYTQTVEGAGASTTYSVAARGEVSASVNASTGEVTLTYDEGKGGAVVVTATDGNLTDYYVITVPYSYSEDVTWKMWGTKLSKDKLNENTSDWGVNYEVRSYNSDTRALTYLNNAVMVANSSVNGTNAYYVGETAGLWFRANAKNFGVRMKTYPDGLAGVDQSDANAVDQALQTMLRYSTDVISHPLMVAYGDKATLTIPDVPAGKYIIMKWQSHDASAGEIQTTSGNLTDLKGTAITADIKIAKVVTLNEGDAEKETAYGTLVFRVATAGDVSFTLNDNGWTELYEITVADAYKSDLNLCNSNGSHIGATNSSIVYDGKASKTVTYKAGPNHARCVRGGTLTFDIVTEGTVEASLNAVKGNDAGSWYDLNLTVTSGVGNVKIIQNVWDNSQKYLLNRLETWIPVGVLETLEYPYTWDFTTRNMNASQQKVSESTVAEDKYGSWNASTGESNSFYVAAATDDNISLVSEKYLFASGSQPTRGTETIAETRGLGIGWANQLCASDTPNRMTLNENGLLLSRRGGQNIIITIPSVATGSYLYIKTANKIKPYIVRSLPSQTSYEALDDSNSDGGAYGYYITKSEDIEIQFGSGTTIQMIGITDVTKSVNKLGFATESRSTAIDHTLTGEFTVNDINAYIITSSNYNYTPYKGATIKLGEPVDVVPANTGVVLYKAETTEQTTAPLFRPAMNIQASAVDGNMMVAMPDGGTVSPTSDGKTAFIMSMYKGTYSSTTQTSTTPTEQTYEGFYRIQTAGTIGANKAYLAIPTSSIPKALWDGGDGQGQAGSAKGYILIDVDYDSETTAVQRAEVETGGANTGVYYSLSGQKLGGKPSAKGVYIKNGKKVFVK